MLAAMTPKNHLASYGGPFWSVILDHHPDGIVAKASLHYDGRVFRFIGARSSQRDALDALASRIIGFKQGVEAANLGLPSAKASRCDDLAERAHGLWSIIIDLRDDI